MKAYHGDEKWKSQVVEVMENAYVKNKPSSPFKYNKWLDDCVVSSKPTQIEYKLGLPMLLVSTIYYLTCCIPRNSFQPTPVSVLSSLKTDKDYGEVMWDFLKWIVTDKLIPELDLDKKSHRKTRKLLDELVESFNGFDSHLVMRNNSEKLSTRASTNKYKPIQGIHHAGSMIYRIVQNRYINPVDNIKYVIMTIDHTIGYFSRTIPQQHSVYSKNNKNMIIEFYNKIQELIKDVDNQTDQ